MVEKAVDASDAYVVEAGDAIAHKLRGQDGFFGDGNVAGAGGDHRDHAFAGDFVIALNGDYAGEFVEFGGAIDALYSGKDFFVGPSDQNILLGVPALHGLRDSHDLFGSFAFAEDHFGESLAQSAVMIHFCEAQVLERQILQTAQRLVSGKASGVNGS
jgi:hypothetical protein